MTDPPRSFLGKLFSALRPATAATLPLPEHDYLPATVTVGTL
jgi:hypothetical protein